MGATKWRTSGGWLLLGFCGDLDGKGRLAESEREAYDGGKSE